MTRDEDREWFSRMLLNRGYDHAKKLGFLETYKRLLGGYTDEQIQEAREDDYFQRNMGALATLHARSKAAYQSHMQRVREAIARGDERLPDVPK
jgi:hypothetical protein